MATSVSETITISENIKQIASNELVSIDIIPFIRAQKIYFRATGLRPSCRHFAFFDRKPVDVWCRQENYETISNDPTEYGNQYNNATEHPEGTTELFSNSNGVLEGSFFLPNTDAISFRTGEREFRLIDISVYDLDTAISTAFAAFTANGLLENRRDVYLKTTTILTTRTVTTYITRYVSGGGGGGGGFSFQGSGFRTFSSRDAAIADGGSGRRTTDEANTPNSRAGDDGGGGGGGGGKIVCTAMNETYGFGSFRQNVWLAHSRNLAPEYQIGYHALFKPLVHYAYQTEKPGYMTLRKILEHIAKHRTADIWKQKRGKRDYIGAIERAFLEPLCYATGWVIMRTKGQ
jgi:hypothetical protein